MKRHNNLQDELFKSFFEKKDVVAEFLEKELPQEVLEDLELESLEQKPASFLRNNHRGSRYADMVWFAKTKKNKNIGFYLHFEAEGGQPQRIARRIWEYQNAMISSFLKNNPNKKIPTILTFVLYHGKQKWGDASKSIADLFEDFDTQYKYGYKAPFVIDLTNLADEEIAKYGKSSPCILTLKAYVQNKLDEYFGDVFKLSLKQKDEKLEEYVFGYYLSKNDGCEEEFLKTIRTLVPEEELEKHVIMLQALREREYKRGREIGIAEGEERGRAEGEERGIKKTLEALKKKGIKDINEDIINELLKKNN